MEEKKNTSAIGNQDAEGEEMTPENNSKLEYGIEVDSESDFQPNQYENEGVSLDSFLGEELTNPEEKELSGASNNMHLQKNLSVEDSEKLDSAENKETAEGPVINFGEIDSMGNTEFLL